MFQGNFNLLLQLYIYFYVVCFALMYVACLIVRTLLANGSMLNPFPHIKNVEGMEFFTGHIISMVAS